METSKVVTIFEGPDGAGKSILAQMYATAYGAKYVHLGPFPGVPVGELARFYADAMMPAVLGYQSVVLDRSWLSEPIYGAVFRPSIGTRISMAHQAMLERLAWRCSPVVVLARPSYETCLSNWSKRRGEEMLTHDSQLRHVYDHYGNLRTSLPVAHYDYTDRKSRGQVDSDIAMARTSIRSWCHLLAYQTAGRSLAPVLLVGEDFAAHTSRDPLYQWPFASFSNIGCSGWMTQQLLDAGVSEADLCWANIDQLPSRWAGGYELDRFDLVVALGKKASEELTKRGVVHVQADHPQYHRRFKNADPYPVVAAIKEFLSRRKS